MKLGLDIMILHMRGDGFGLPEKTTGIILYSENLNEDIDK